MLSHLLSPSPLSCLSVPFSSPLFLSHLVLYYLSQHILYFLISLPSIPSFLSLFYLQYVLFWILWSEANHLRSIHRRHHGEFMSSSFYDIILDILYWRSRAYFYFIYRIWATLKYRKHSKKFLWYFFPYFFIYVGTIPGWCGGFFPVCSEGQSFSPQRSHCCHWETERCHWKTSGYTPLLLPLPPSSPHFLTLPSAFILHSLPLYLHPPLAS